MKTDCKNNYSLSIIAKAFNKRYSQTSSPFIIELETSEMGYPKYWSSEIFKKYFNKNK